MNRLAPANPTARRSDGTVKLGVGEQWKNQEFLGHITIRRRSDALVKPPSGGLGLQKREDRPAALAGRSKWVALKELVENCGTEILLIQYTVTSTFSA